MHQPWQEFGIKTHIIESSIRKRLANRPTAAAREPRMRSGGLHPITDLKWLCHLVEPFPPQRHARARPRWGVSSVYAERWHPSCQDMAIGVSENLLTQQRP